MEKYKTKIKCLVIILLCITVAAIVAGTVEGAQSVKYLTDLTGGELLNNNNYVTVWNHLKGNAGNILDTGNINLLNPNKYAFCVENRVNPYKGKYNISRVYAADDDYLAYILAANEGTWDNDIGLYKYKNIRQNLIWYYVYNKANKGTSPIYQAGLRQSSNWPSSGTTLAVSDIQTQLNEIEEYVKRQQEFGIQIDSIEEVNGKIQVTVSGTFDTYDLEYYKDEEWIVFGNDIKNSSNSIDKEAFNGQSEIKVRVIAKIQRYEANYIILSNASAQDFLIRNGKTVENYDSDEKSIKNDIEKIDISLQKYITYVNDTPMRNKGNDNYKEEYDINGDGYVTIEDIKMVQQIAAKTFSWDNFYIPDGMNKEEVISNAKSKADLNKDGTINAADTRLIVRISQGMEEQQKEILIFERENMIYSSDDKDIYDAQKVLLDIKKDEHPVEIVPGDTVTYRIYVYNNSSKTANFKIVDTLPENAKIEKIYFCKTDITNNTNYLDANTVNKIKNGETIKSFETISRSIPGNGTIYFDIKLKFDSNIESYKNNKDDFASKIYYNKAELIVDGNDTVYRTVDYDWVEVVYNPEKAHMYAVSLEKFASKKTTEKGEEDIKYSLGLTEDEMMGDSNEHDRSGRRYTESDWKEKNKVVVKNGDEVTYTIRLANTGRFPVKITKVYDVVTDITKNGTDYEGTQLEYVSASGNGDNIIATLETNEGVSSYYTIQFKNAKTLQPGESVDVYIKFKVIIKNPTNSEKEISIDNLASIYELRDENNNIIASMEDNDYPSIAYVDYDGIDNNIDMDFLKPHFDDVSLQKYIVSVGENSERVSRKNWISDVSDVQSSKDNVNMTGNKYTSPVVISREDIVTYRIELYDNNPLGGEEEKIVKIIDKIPEDVWIKSLKLEATKKSDGSKIYGTIIDDYEENDDYENNDFVKNVKIRTDNFEIEVKMKSGIYSYAFIVELDFSEIRTTGVFKNEVELTEVNWEAPTTKYRTKDADYVKIEELGLPDVSLQKYIVKVGDGELSEKRKDTKATADESLFTNPEHKSYLDENFYKEENPVEIKKGDRVTYRIYAYNNNSAPIDVEILDLCSDGMFEKVYLTHGKNSESIDVTSDCVIENADSLSAMRYKIEGLGADDAYLDVIVKYDNPEIEEILANVALISVSDGDSLTEYRTVDSDYVKVVDDPPGGDIPGPTPMDISLQKHIYKINGEQVSVVDEKGNKRSRANAGYSFNSAGSDDGKKDIAPNKSNYGFDKFKNPVKIAAGDEVEYEIVVYNNDPEKVAENVKIVDRLYNYDGEYSIVSITEGSKELTGEGGISITEATDGKRRILFLLHNR